MSFADYGFDIFPYSIQDHGCAGQTQYAKQVHDNNVPFDLKELDNLGNLCYNVIDNLVDLGINTENELILAKEELRRYKNLQRNGLHEGAMQNSEPSCENSEESERLVQDTNLDVENNTQSLDDSKSVSGNSNDNPIKNTTWNLFPCLSLFGKKNVNNEPKMEENKLPEQNQNSSKVEVSDEYTETQLDSVSVKEEEVQTSEDKDEEEDTAAETDGVEEETVDTDREQDDVRTLSDESFRTAIIEKDSEIICLKNENAVKDAELKELEDHNKKLEDMIGKLKSNIEILEKTSRISEEEIQELIRKKNEEINFARHNNFELEQELKEERKARIMDEREVIHLRSFIQETQACHKNINDELKVTKRRLEAIESSNSSYAATIKLLQHERDELDKINSEQEVEIKKLLNIIQRLREKYDSAREELYNSTEELLSREKQVDQCRKQLETTELEVSKLIADLAECLGRVAHIEKARICTISSTGSSRRPSIYAQAREMTRALDKIVQEHLHCNAHRADLIREINRLRAREENRSWSHSKMIQAELSSDESEGTPSESDLDNSNHGRLMGQIESNASIQTSTKDTGDENLEDTGEHRSTSQNNSDSTRSIRTSTKDTGDEGLEEIEEQYSVGQRNSEGSRSMRMHLITMNSTVTVYEGPEKTEKQISTRRNISETSKSIQSNSVYTLDERNETEELTSESQNNLEHAERVDEPDQKIVDDEEKIKCESFLIQELDSLQKALDVAQKISNDLYLVKTTESNEKAKKDICESETKRLLGQSMDYSELENNLFGPVLQRLQNFTRIVIKIIAVLRIDSDSNIEHLKILEDKTEKTLNSLRDANFEKCQLQSEINEYQKKCEELTDKIKTLEDALNSKSEKLSALIDEKTMRYESWCKEVEAVREQLTTVEKKLNHSRVENLNLVEKSESLQRELQKKDEKLREYGILVEKSESLQRELQKKDEKLQDYEILIEQREILQRELQKKDRELQDYEILVEKSEILHQELQKKDEELQEYANLVEKSETLQLELQRKDEKLQEYENLVEQSEILQRELQEKDKKLQEFEILVKQRETLQCELEKMEEKLQEYENLVEQREILQRELQEKDEKLQDYEILVEKSKNLQRELLKKDEKLQNYVTLIEKSETIHRELQKKDEKLQSYASLVEKCEALQRELLKKDEKLQEYGKFNEHLNNKLQESNKMIEQLQITIRQESAIKAEYTKFENLHDRIKELMDEKEKLAEKLSNMNSQLSSYEKNNASMQNNINRVIEDNEYLEKCIETFKNENDRLEVNIANSDDIKAKIASQFDGLLLKIEKINDIPKKLSLRSSTLSHTDVMIRGLEKALISHKEKLRVQQRELQSKEQEINEKNKRIETLNTQISKAKLEITTDNATILKRIEILTLEKAELRSELKQTLSKYEDKLSEMHKQYKQNEVELHKNHNESIKRLEAKYIDIMKDEEKAFNFDNWLKSLSATEMQKIHDKVCTSLRKVTHDKDIPTDYQKKRTLTSRSTVSTGFTKKTPPMKKNVPNIKAASASRPGSPFSVKSKKSATSRSMSVQEREYISFRNKKLNF